MKKKWVGFSSLAGVLATASGILAPEAFASGWCPNSRDYIISCDNCSRELTCDVYNTTIWIYGTGVTLHGQAHTLHTPPGPGIKVFKPGATIKSLAIFGAGTGNASPEGHGIYFVGPASGLTSHVENVIVSASTGYGLYNAGGSPVRVHDGHFYSNGKIGIYGAGPQGAYTDIYLSSGSGNGTHGYVTTTPAAYVFDSWLEGNKSYGLYANGLGGLVIQGNKINSNYRGLFLSNTIAPSVIGNTGSGNTVIDCYDSGSTNGRHYGNSWGTASGTNCTP